MGKAMVNMILTFAQLEREMTAERTRNKMLWHAEQGLWNGGRPPGYRLDPKQKGILFPDTEEKNLAELLFKKYLELGSAGELAKYLARQGIKTPSRVSRRGRKVGGKPFYKPTILSILRNPVYIGKIRYNGKVFRGRHEPIISEELFNQVNAHLMLHAAKRRNPRTPREHVYMLQGLVICGKCGAYMTPKTCTSTKQDNFYYQCTKSGHTNGGLCDMRYAPAPALEQAILGKLREIALMPGEIERIVRDANANTDGSLKELVEDRRRVETRLETIVAETRKIVDVLKELGKDGLRTVGDELRKLEGERVALEAQRDEIAEELKVLERRSMDATVMATSLRTFADIVDEATPQELKGLLPKFVERIVLHEPDKSGNGKMHISLFECPVQRDGNGCNQSGSRSAESSDWLPECTSMRTRRGGDTPEIWFRIVHVALDAPNGAPVAAYREQKVEIALGPKGAFENGNIGTLTRRVPADRVVNALPPRVRNRKPPKAPRTPRVVELLRKAIEWQALLESGEEANQAAIARREGITRARVTQVMGMLRLAPEIQQQVLSLPDMVRRPAITERALRPIAQLDSRQQADAFQSLLQSP